MSNTAHRTTAIALAGLLAACVSDPATDPPRGLVRATPALLGFPSASAATVAPASGASAPGAPAFGAASAAEVAPAAAGVREQPAAAGAQEQEEDEEGPGAEEVDEPAPAPEPEPKPAAEPTELFGVPVRGSLVTRALVRSADGDTEVDLYGFLSADVGDERTGDWTGRFAGRVSLDGGDDQELASLLDTWDGALNARVYDAWVQWSGWDDVPLVRLGRQSDWETPEFLVYDGVRLESRELGERDTRVGVYGGIPVHQYESSPEGDLLGGAYVEGRPWRRGRARLDVISAEDEVGGADLDGTLVGVSVGHSFEALRLRGAYSHLDGDPRDLELGATWTDLEEDFVVSAEYFELFEEEGANPLEFETFATTLFEYQPFRRVGLTAAKGVAEDVRVEGGVQLRQVSDSGDEGTFNRDYDRWFATAAFSDVGTEDLTLSVTGDLWNSDAQETWSVGAAAAYELDERTRASLGTYYALYEFDELLIEEREDVRTYYVGYERDLSESLELEARYAFEDGDTEEFHTLRLKLSWRF